MTEEMKLQIVDLNCNVIDSWARCYAKAEARGDTSKMQEAVCRIHDCMLRLAAMGVRYIGCPCRECGHGPALWLRVDPVRPERVEVIQ